MNMIWLPAPTGCGSVVKAAEALGISEYDFFRLAYRRWSGHEAFGDVLEQTFVDYMFHRRVPMWVRHLSREVLELRDADCLDPQDFDIDDLQRRQPIPRLGRFSWRLVAAAIFLIFLMSMDTTYMKDPAAPVGCPGATGSMFFDRLAGMFKQRSNLSCSTFTYPGTRDNSASL